MVFSSIVFLLYFFPIFLFTYYLADKKYKNIILLFFSIFFYCWGAPKFVFVILCTTFFDFHLVKWMSVTNSTLYRRLFLLLSVLINLGLLLYFKYSNFFVENVNQFLTIFGSKNIHWTKILLPLGISFYTFQAITYVVDIYRGIQKPFEKFWDYQLYILLFPKLLAGPIVRYQDIAGQIIDRSENDNIDNKLIGFYRFVIGLSKKVLIANILGQQADAIFALDYSGLDTFTAWIGILTYTFQIYFDFSGYSDMAIGIGKMLGFKFPENFDNPYTSQSITEFWRRWHISLGNWLRIYLFTPLSLNFRNYGKTGLALSLLITFSICGLWHGASWSFILWGTYYGLILILESLFLLKWYKKIKKFLRVFITFIIVVIGWVFFRANKISDALHYLKRMFSFSFKRDISFDSEFYTIFFIAAIFVFLSLFKFGQRMQNAFYFDDYSNKRHLIIIIPVLILLVVSISSITAFGFNPFIYFRF
jgi:alginate O-acetyltransferase complex protein AlgI